MRPLLVASLALLAIAVGAAGPTGAGLEVIAIPGTRVTIEPPPDFVLASQFPGVQNAEIASAIMVSELPAPMEAFTAGFTAEELLSRGMTLRSSEQATVAGRPVRLISVKENTTRLVCRTDPGCGRVSPCGIP